MSREFENFGKYILVEKLASGGMAEIFLARRTGAEGLIKFIALKRILPHFSDNPDFIDMFTKEAKIVINLAHRNIVSIHEFGKEDDRLFLTMDYVEGVNLRQMTRKMSSLNIHLPLEHIIYVIKEVAAGLDYAHRCLDGSTGKPLNIIHRDISPQNIMINFEGEIKIVDFGIAKSTNQMEHTASRTLKGKFRYMSPEQASGKKVDHRTDIFALGIILWELLANKRLFTGENEISLIQKVQKCEIPHIHQFNPFINPKLETIIKKSLAKEPKARYQRAETFFKDLNKYLNRQYPDFSTHDFSDFVKSLYNKEISSLKKRLITYVNATPTDHEADHEETKKIKQNKPSFKDPKASGDKNELTVSSTTEVTEKTNEPRSENSISNSESDFSKEKKLKNQTLLKKDEKTKIVSLDGLKTSSSPFKGSGSNKSDFLEKKEKENKAAQTISLKNKSNPFSFKKKNTSSYSSSFKKEKFSSMEKNSLPEPTNFYSNNEEIKKSQKNTNEKRNLKNINTINESNQINQEVLKKESSNIEISGFETIGTNPTFSKSKKKYSKAFIILMTIVLLAISSGYLFFHPNKNIREGFRKNVKKASKVIPLNQKQNLALNYRKDSVSEKSGKRHPSSKSSWSNFDAVLFVNSVPSGAKIFIDHRDTKKTTPARVEVPSSKSFSLKLKKKFYRHYTKNGILLEKDNYLPITAQLVKIKIAYLNIDALPRNAVKVFINDVPLKRVKFPLKNHKVPALHNLRIKFLNLKTQQFEVKDLRLKEGEKKSIFFNFK